MKTSTAIKNARLDTLESIVGTSPKLRFYTGSEPATTADAASGTQLVELTLPSNWMGDAASSAKALAGSWTGTASATGTAGYWRIYDSAGSTCHWQGSAAMTVTLSTNSSTAANSNVLNFASTTGVAVGMFVSGTGIVTGSYVLAVGPTSVTLSHASTAGVGSGVSIAFKGDVALDNTSIANGQPVTVTAFDLTELA